MSGARRTIPCGVNLNAGVAKAAGVSHTMVGRIWRTFRLQPHRTETSSSRRTHSLWRRSVTSSGWTCTAGQCGGLLGRRELADPGAATRAAHPADGLRPTGTPDAQLRLTLDLFAALNVATGEVIARCKPQHRAQDFVAFLRDIEATVDPCSTSTSSSTICRPTARPGAAVVAPPPPRPFHFTPTYASWLTWWSGSLDC